VGDDVLHHLRLTSGETVRFRKANGGRWLPGKMSGVAADGSITIHDTNGAARSLRPERVEVRRPGVRGRLTWQRVSDVAVTWEQLALWGDAPAAHGGRRQPNVSRR
jgi:hypothetical protein